MIKSKEDLHFYIQEDRKRNLGAYKLGVLNYLVKYLYGTDGMKAYRYLKALRKLEYAQNCLKDRNLFGRMIFAFRKMYWHHLSVKYDISIGANMVGYGFWMPHVIGGGVIINCNSIGCYCFANAGVILGNNHTGDERPTVGDYVGFTMGSKAYGNIHIGNNVTVAPNSVVVKDVPDNCVVSGIPAKIIKIKSNQ